MSALKCGFLCYLSYSLSSGPSQEGQNSGLRNSKEYSGHSKCSTWTGSPSHW